MKATLHGAIAVLGLLIVTGTASFAHGMTIVVTAQELIQNDHRVEVKAGTEVVWGDAHFERVWFPAGGDTPKVTRFDGGLRARFDKPGTYRGRFTIVGGHRSNDVYPLVITVTE